MVGVLFRNFALELNAVQPSQVSKVARLRFFALRAYSFWCWKSLRKGDNETSLLLLIVHVLYLTKACISRCQPFSLCSPWLRSARASGRGAADEARPSAVDCTSLFLIPVLSVTPFQFWMIRFIYYFIYFSTFPFAFETVSICFSEGFPSALSHTGHCFYRVKKMIVGDFESD